MSKPEFEREVRDLDNAAMQANEYIEKAAKLVAPYGATWLGSFTQHTYARSSVITGKHEVLLVTQDKGCQGSMQDSVSAEVRQLMLPEYQARMHEVLGADIRKLGPKTNAQMQEDRIEIMEITGTHMPEVKDETI